MYNFNAIRCTVSILLFILNKTETLLEDNLTVTENITVFQGGLCELLS